MATRLTRDFLQREYWDLGKSPYEIADEVGTYPNAVRRELLRHWASLRDKSEAQANALRRGRQTHPTEGVGHSPEARERIRLAKQANQLEYNKECPAGEHHEHDRDGGEEGDARGPEEAPGGG